MAFEQLGQAVPVEERELGWDDTIEKERRFYHSAGR